MIRMNKTIAKLGVGIIVLAGLLFQILYWLRTMLPFQLDYFAFLEAIFNFIVLAIFGATVVLIAYIIPSRITVED